MKRYNLKDTTKHLKYLINMHVTIITQLQTLILIYQFACSMTEFHHQTSSTNEQVYNKLILLVEILRGGFLLMNVVW